jgi:hypothetical protein
MTYQFDHLVVMGRDRMESASDIFTSLGFSLSPISKHNLGSSNRLAVFDSSYLEVLGWEANSTPTRKEIADEPFGLNALVFRTTNADACHQHLVNQGFAPNPIQDLSRPVKFGNETGEAKFRTIRFASQPISGLRIYFCEHLTPEYIWREDYMTHPNQMGGISEIEITSFAPEKVYLQLIRLLMHQTDESQDLPKESSLMIQLENCLFKIKSSGSQQGTFINSFTMMHKSGIKNLVVDKNVFNI